MTPRHSRPPSDAIHSVHRGDPDAAALIDLFAAGLPGRMRALEALLSESRLDELRDAARRLSRSSGASGFEAIASEAAALERALCAEPDLSSISRVIEDLAALCRRVVP